MTRHSLLLHYDRELRQAGVKPSEHGPGLQHTLWKIERTLACSDPEKAERWFGLIQWGLHANGVFTYDQLIEHRKQCEANQEKL